MTLSPLDYASFYSEHGWEIFPCKPKDKTPLVKWADVATSDMFQIAEWWSKFPDANIGLATGTRSGLFALDVDARHGGEETLAEYIKQNGSFPATPISKTGGGGHHYLFKMPDLNIRNNAGKLGNGLDIRGQGGYIVVPPSLHPSGNRYEWEAPNVPSKVPLSDAPNWLLRILEEKQQENTPAPLTAEGIFPNGQRHHILVSMAGAMRRRGMTTEAIFQALWAENMARCVPPAPEANIRKIAESMEIYDPSLKPELQARDRITSEWSFAKSIYESPESYADFQWLDPSFFGDPKVAEYWRDVVSGMGVAQAAANAEILTELEKYQDYLVPRLPDYAENIHKFGRSSIISGYGWKLQKAAEEMDETKISRVVTEINRSSVIVKQRGGHISEAWDEFESEVKERAENPTDVWGIHFPFAPYLSLLTGGKQTGELILSGGEPGIGKSWFWLQDALETALGQPTHPVFKCDIPSVPVLYWSGEMKRKQIIRRMATLLGLNSRRSKTGRMNERDWGVMDDVKALLYNADLVLDDQPLQLHELRPMLKQMNDKYGIKEFVLDYGLKINAPGKDEIEKTTNISNEVKDICNALNMAGVLIVSVTKEGMDTMRTAKSKIRGSGQQIHDADVIFTMSKYDGSRKTPNMYIKPQDEEKAITIHIDKGRELDHHLPGGMIDFMRLGDTPKFKEMKDIENDMLPDWLERKDIT